MRIVDGTSRLVRSRPVTFRAAEISEDAFGYNMPNMALNAALETTLGKENRVRCFGQAVTGWENREAGITATLADGNRILARLAVGADGRNSLAANSCGNTNPRLVLSAVGLCHDIFAPPAA